MRGGGTMRELLILMAGLFVTADWALILYDRRTKK